MEGEGEERSTDLVHLSGNTTCLVPDGRPSSKMELYVLKQDVSAATKKARAMCQDADVFNPLTFTGEAERELEINVKDMCDALTESFVNGKITEMTESESVHYQSTIINHVDSVTIRGKGMLRERSRVKISKELRGHILMIY